MMGGGRPDLPYVTGDTFSAVGYIINNRLYVKELNKCMKTIIIKELRGGDGALLDQFKRIRHLRASRESAFRQLERFRGS